MAPCAQNPRGGGFKTSGEGIIRVEGKKRPVTKKVTPFLQVRKGAMNHYAIPASGLLTFIFLSAEIFLSSVRAAPSP